MASRPFPIVLWGPPEGPTTGVVVGDVEPVAATGSNAAEVIRQLKEVLEWRFEHEPWNADPDLLEPSLFEVKVEIRPQYVSRRRVVPVPETVWLSVPCVVGRQQSGAGLCVVPHLSIQFNFQENAAVKGLVAHFVREALQRFEPVELMRRWPPAGCRLDQLVMRVPADRERNLAVRERPELQVLFTVAGPLLLDHGRRRSVSAAYGRDVISQGLTTKLDQKANVLLVGEAGVGKSTVLFDAVKRLARQPVKSSSGQPGTDKDAAHDLRRYRHWRTSGSRLIAGMRYLGQWEERCDLFIDRLGKVDGVFCAENLLELVSVGGEGAGDSVAAFLLPFLQRGELRMVAEATPAELEACRRLLPGLVDTFQILPVPTLDDGAAVRILEQIAESQATSAKVKVEPGVVLLTHRLFKRFQPYAAFPGPAAGFVRQLCAAATAGKSAQLTRAHVIDAFVRRTGLPERFLRDEMLLQVEDLKQSFAEKIIGQPEATGVAARLVATIKAGLNDPARPLGVLLFCGPTGVGKTALARLLAEYCFGAGAAHGHDRLIRLDMSEYGGWGAARRLLENAPGQPAAWIEGVRRQPFCVVLLDEIEKAAPEVFDVLLSLLDEGRLTDPLGRVTWFRSAIVILTSNLGASLTGATGFVPPSDSGYAAAVSKYFRPEFFNRLDAVVTFKPLERSAVERIARKEMSDLAGREGLAAARLRLEWSEELVSLVAEAGYDLRLGARPLQRALERLVVTPLARWKVAHPEARDRTIRIGCREGAVTIELRP